MRRKPRRGIMIELQCVQFKGVSGFTAKHREFGPKRFERSRTGQASSASSRGVQGHAV